jgi:ankyrin repeat protein
MHKLKMKRKREESQNEVNTIQPLSINLEIDENLVLSNDKFETNIKSELQNIEISNTDKLNSVAEYPTPYIFAKFSLKAYDKTNKENYENDLPACWQLLTTAFNEFNGYFGAAYWNHKRQQIIIAHRGTYPHPEVIWTDIKGIIMNKFVIQMNSASTFAEKVCSAIRAINKEFNMNLQLFFTGHSLGAWLAQITTFTTKYLRIYNISEKFSTFQNYVEEGHHAHTVVFDSPGCKEMLSNMADQFSVRYDEKYSIDINSLDITSYLSAPNIVNTYNRHVGKIYRIFVKLSDNSIVNKNSYSTIRKILNNIKNFVTLKFTRETHSMDKILEVFDSNTGHIRVNNEIKICDVVDWPIFGFEHIKYIKDSISKNDHVDWSEERFCPIRYKTKPFNEKECSVNVFTESEKKFLNMYQTLAQEPDIFQLDNLFDSISNERVQVQEILNGFNIDDTIISCESAGKLHKFIPYVKLLLQIYPGLKVKADECLNNFGFQFAKKFYQLQTENYLTGQLNTFDFQNNNDIKNSITDFLNDKQNNVWQSVVQEDTRIGLTNIYKVLEKLNLKEYNFVTLDLERLLNANRILSLKKLFEYNELTNILLMIEFKLNDNIDLEMVNYLFEELFSVPRNESKSIKIIFITQDNEFSRRLPDLCTKFNFSLYTKIHQGIKWNDFTNETKLKILETKVLFQGNESILNKLTNGLSDEKLNQLFSDSKTIVKLLNNNNLIEIGCELSFDYDECFYIPRSLTYYTKIKNNLFKNNEITDKFLISGDTEKAKKLLSNSLEAYSFESNNLQASIKFEEICKIDEKSKVHWLKYESKNFIWQKSQGNLSILHDYIEDKSYTKTYSEEALTKEEITSKIYIISDTAGMGKSTFLTHLSKQIKQNVFNNDSWLIRMNLNDYTAELNERLKNQTDFKKDDNAIEFLADIVLNKSCLIEQKLFKHNIKTGKSIIMFDGFDEISPDYKNIVIDLLKALIRYNTKQLWITTRPNMKFELENTLQQFAYTLQPFSRENQEDFLKKFWMNKLEISESDCRLSTYADAFLNNLGKSIRDKDFTSIPLQTRMLAEVYEFDELESRLNTQLDLNDLYEKFLKKKYEINIKEKNEIDLTKPQNKNELEIKTKIYENEYQIMAVYTIFNENVCEKLLQKDEVQIKKTFIQEFREGHKNIGIIDQIIGDKPKFIHRTFAEYLVVTFLINRLDREEILEFLIKEILLESDYQVIRAFINSWLKPANRTLELNKNNLEKLWQKDNKCFSKSNEDEDSIIHITVKEKNLEILKFIVENAKDKLDINAKNENGNTVIHLVASEENLEIGKYLVENFKEKLDINSKNEKGTTALHKAASKNNVEIIQFLVEKFKDKLEINAKNEFSNNVLHQAALRENLKMIKYLVENFKEKLEINAKNYYGNTALDIAAAGNCRQIEKYLRENFKEKLDINVKDKHGDTVLHQASGFVTCRESIMNDQ